MFCQIKSDFREMTFEIKLNLNKFLYNNIWKISMHLKVVETNERVKFDITIQST